MNKAKDSLFMPIVTVITNRIPGFLWVILDFIVDLCFFWVKKVIAFYNRKDPLKEYVEHLKHVLNYNEWKRTVVEIDKLTNMDLWRQNFILKHYDYVLIDERTKLLREARLNDSSQTLMSLLRSGLIRNFGGIAQKRLFMKSYMGTKFKIEEYITEVLDCLDYLNESINEGEDGFIMNGKQLKLDFFHDAKQSFGSTALLLQGGSLFGLCHLGVVKALFFKGLLPKVIGGLAVGAAVASLVCTLTKEELLPILVSNSDFMKDIDVLNHDVDERYGNVIENVVQKGYSQDILLFLKFVRDTIGDLTFEEAYLKTEKILNIVVHTKNPSVPSLLNYISAPNVIIWTAIYASIGTGVLSDNVQLYVKDFNNNVVPRDPNSKTVFLKPQDVTYQQQYFNYPVKKEGVDGEDGTGDKFQTYIQYPPTKENSPYTRLTELFNVNHFIISLARPYLAPLFSYDLKHYHAYGRVKYNGANVFDFKAGLDSDDEVSTPMIEKAAVLDKYTSDSGTNFFKLIRNLIGMEIQHRLVVLNKLGILGDIFKRLFIDEKPTSLQSLASNREITIVPELRYLLKDFGRVFDVYKSMENIPYWVLVGERSVWPLFPLLWTRCSIEFALDDLYNLQRRKSSE